MYDINESIKAQAQYCIEKDMPHFAPANGRCWTCQKNIYTKIEKVWNGKVITTGITTKEASAGLVTGCPHCNRSYCD